MKKIKQLLKYLWNSFKHNWQVIFAFSITYIIPVAMLSEIMVFTKEVPAGKKLTFMGCLAIGILFIIFRKKLKEAIIRMHKGVLRGILKIIMIALFWVIIYGIIIGLAYVATIMESYWIRVAYCFAIGHIFYFIDEVKNRRRKPKVILEEDINE